MADELSALVLAAYNHPFVTVHTEVGEDGQGIIYLKKDAPHKGVNGRSYQAALIQTQAIARLAKQAGKTFGIGAIILTHGETDCGNRDYETQLLQLWKDYNADLSAITGQSRPIQMILSQQNALYTISTQIQWKIGLDNPAGFVCSGPKYQYPYFKDHVHLTTEGYRQLGEKYAEVYFQRIILGSNWQPLQPTSMEQNGTAITIHFHVPNAPLAWDSAMNDPHTAIPEWRNGKGFEVQTAAGARIPIADVQISGSDSVIIHCVINPGPGAHVRYAFTADPKPMHSPFAGTVHWGLLHDSDPFVGIDTRVPQPNYCVAFELETP
jgi:hypothetical protein